MLQRWLSGLHWVNFACRSAVGATQPVGVPWSRPVARFAAKALPRRSADLDGGAVYVFSAGPLGHRTSISAMTGAELQLSIALWADISHSEDTICQASSP